MSDPIAGLNLFASGWAGAVGRACWQGGLAILLVWGLCRLLPRLSGRVQCWLWRLAYLKLLVALLWGAPLCLALLPPPPKPSLPPASLPASAGEARGAAAQPATGPAMIPGAEESLLTPPRARRLEATGGLLLLWLLGVAGVGAQVLGDWRRTQRLRVQGGAVRDEALLTDCRALSRRFGVRQEPTLLTAEDLSCPVLVGVAHPAVLLPASFPAQFTPSQMRLMLAHELAHLRRRDLLWAWLPSLARVLFFFHPLVWLAEGEWRLAQEMACDEQVVLSTGTSQARYGAMLLEVMGEPRRAFPASLLTAGVAESYTTIRRRLVAIQQVRAVSPQRWALATLFLAAAGSVAVVPWRLTVRPAAMIPRSSPPEIASQAAETARPPGRRESATLLPRMAEARPVTPHLSERGDGLPEQERLDRPAASRPQPWRESQRPGNVPPAGARPEGTNRIPLQRAAGQEIGGARGGAGQANAETRGTPPATGPQDAGAADAPPVPVDPGTREEIGKLPPHEPLEASSFSGKEPSPPVAVEKLKDETFAKMNAKEPEFRNRFGVSAILLVPKSLAGHVSPLGWSPSPLLRRPGRLTLVTERKIDPRDLKKILAAASQGGALDPKLAEQMWRIDPRVLKKMLAQVYPAPATDARSVDDEKLMALKRSMAEAHRKEALDTKLPDAMWISPPDKELLRSKKLDQLKREAEENHTKEIRHDGPVDEGVPDR
jgi:beta-lactamase regulating signal transducer with metallopeptidase domain